MCPLLITIIAFSYFSTSPFVSTIKQFVRISIVTLSKDFKTIFLLGLIHVSSVETIAASCDTYNINYSNFDNIMHENVCIYKCGEPPRRTTER